MSESVKLKRRLPVYLVLDVSGSMSGEPIEAVRNGVDIMIAALKGEPQALETAAVSIITFNSTAKQIVPLTDLLHIQKQNFDAGGATSMGAALTLLCSKIDTEVVRTTPDSKGDWKPMVFLFTDGYPTDEWQQGASLLKSKKVSVLVACHAGTDETEESTNVLKQIVDDPDVKDKEGYVRMVVTLKSTNATDIKTFFRWVTASINNQSQKAEGVSFGEGIIPPLPPGIEIKV